MALADLYCQGYELPWDRLFPPRMRRIGLPTYPFAREHYWVGETGPVAATGVAGAAAGTGHAAEMAAGTLMLQACWNEQDIPHPVTLSEYAHHLVIFCDLPQQGGVESVINSRVRGARCLFLRQDAQNIEARFQLYAARVLTEIQGLIAGTGETVQPPA